METQEIMCLLLVLGLLSLTETLGEWGFNVEEFEESLGLFYVGGAPLICTEPRGIS